MQQLSRGFTEPSGGTKDRYQFRQTLHAPRCPVLASSCARPAGRSPRLQRRLDGGDLLEGLAGCRGERAAGGAAKSAAAGAKRGSLGQMQISAELVPIPDASRMRPDASGCVRMRRDASGF